MKIVLDTLGGDLGAIEHVVGAVEAVKEKQGFNLVLVGNKEELDLELGKYEYDKSRIETVNSTEIITCEDAPMEAIRRKTDSSLIVAYKLLKEDDEVKALVSTGSTGAVLAGGIFKLGRLKGVNRPALAPILPTMTDGKVMLCDSGANVDCKPANLVQFAIMASSYMQRVMGIESPRVALLSNGTEDTKGCELNKQVFKLLSETKGINFVGNMEAREMLSGNYDVVVADGFHGNIALKGLEGGVKAVTTVLKQGIKKSFKAKIGYLFLKGVMADIKQKLDYNKVGGAVLMGLDKIVVKAHGSADRDCVKTCIMQALQAVEKGVIEAVSQGINANAEVV